MGAEEDDGRSPDSGDHRPPPVPTFRRLDLDFMMCVCVEWGNEWGVRGEVGRRGEGKERATEH